MTLVEDKTSPPDLPNLGAQELHEINRAFVCILPRDAHQHLPIFLFVSFLFLLFLPFPQSVPLCLRFSLIYVLLSDLIS